MSTITDKVIADAKAYFDTHVGTIGIRKLNKIALWDNAYIAHTKSGDRIMVPIKYDKNYTFTTNFSGDAEFILAKQSQLAVYKNAVGTYAAEIITFYPAKSFLDHTDKSFSGYLTVEDWTGNNLRTDYFKNGQAYIFANQNKAGRTNTTCTVVNHYECPPDFESLVFDCIYLGSSYYDCPDEAYIDPNGGDGDAVYVDDVQVTAPVNWKLADAGITGDGQENPTNWDVWSYEQLDGVKASTGNYFTNVTHTTSTVYNHITNPYNSSIPWSVWHELQNTASLSGSPASTATIIISGKATVNNTYDWAVTDKTKSWQATTVFP